MPQIRVLPVNLRNKIAAGEVVERPASVVKELVENSIDAGSSRVKVDILKAGKRLVRVSDNGAGMKKEDALLSFERYATSKIIEEKDLFNIMTLGFRGEALSSIASVARVKLSTAVAGETGTCIEISGGEVRDVRDCPMTGTTIEVNDLFYNTPARRKFLKSDSTENYHIISSVTQAALSHYQIGFVLNMDGDDVLDLPAAASLRERLVQVYGTEFVTGLKEIEKKAAGFALRSFASEATHLKNNKSNQFIFINKRAVKDQSLSYAVYRAYEGLLPKDKHPVFFLFIEMNPEQVDFNVHPAKREVRFADKNSVFNFVYQSVKSGLGWQEQAGIAPDTENGMKDTGYVAQDYSPAAFAPGPMASPSAFQVAESLDAGVSNYFESVPFLYLGDTFVAVSGREGLTLIDYHAAHERVNYERFLKKIDMPSCMLLFPQQIKLDSGSYRVILENSVLLAEFGMDVDDFGHDTVIVRSLPEMLKGADLPALMSDVTAALLNKDSTVSGEDMGPIDSMKKELAASLACHSSIRGKEVPDGPRIAELLKALDKTDNPDRCPHGRPARIFLSLNELKKMFRKV